MSLIALAQHVRGPRTLTRTLLLLVLLTGGVILGLLAMHSLNTHTAASAHPASVSHVAHDEPVAHPHDGDGVATLETACPDCADHDTMMTMICVLGLLVTLLVLIRPTHPWPARTALARTARQPAPDLDADATRPPSLNVLCISRT